MPMRGYEFYLRVVDSSERSERVRYRVEHSKIKFISISKYVIFCLLYKHRWNTKSACFQRCDLLRNHNDGDLFTCEDNMLSSRVKISSFRGKAHLVFHCVYTINTSNSQIIIWWSVLQFGNPYSHSTREITN